MTRSICALITALSVLASCHNAQASDPPKDVSDWRTVSDNDLVILTLEHGDVILELNRDFAPGHAAQFATAANAGHYDNTSFYRVIESFVAQGGPQGSEELEALYPTLKNEIDHPKSEEGFAPLGNVDLFTDSVGHINGFPVGRSENIETEWLLHCPGALALGRDNDPDSASLEFYIVLDAQRYLDRNLTIFGRVLSGMEHLQALQRGDPEVEMGVIQAPVIPDPILTIRTSDSLPENERPVWEVMVTSSQAFEDFKTSKRIRDHEWFYRRPPEILDICGFQTPARQKSPQ